MRHFLKVTVCAGLLVNAGAAFASCSTTMDDIASRIHANGVPYNQFSLNTVKLSDADSAEGEMVGSCSNRYFAIMYTQHAPRPSSGTHSDKHPTAQAGSASGNVSSTGGNDEVDAQKVPQQKAASTSSQIKPADNAPAARRHDTYEAASMPDTSENKSAREADKKGHSMADTRTNDLFKSEADGTPWYLK